MSKTYKIMCVNAGSSSLKFKLYEMDDSALKEKKLRDKGRHLNVLTSGIVERIGHEDGIFTIKKPGGFKKTVTLPVSDHEYAVHLGMGSSPASRKSLPSDIESSKADNTLAIPPSSPRRRKRKFDLSSLSPRSTTRLTSRALKPSEKSFPLPSDKLPSSIPPSISP